MNSRGWPAVIIGLCVGAIFLSVADQRGGQTPMPFGLDPATSQSDWTEEHEANGPGGTQGVPMTRLPLEGACLAAAILLAGTGLAVIERKRNSALLDTCKSGK